MTTSVDLLERDPTTLSQEELEALVASADTGEEDPQAEEGVPAGAGEEKTEGTKEKPVEAAPAPPPAPTDEFDPRNVVVKTADGKHEIPYQAYDSARKRAGQEAEGRRVAEEAAQMERSQREVVERALEEAKAQLAAAQKPGAAPAQVPEGLLSSEQMEVLKEEAPSIHAALVSMNAQVAQLRQAAADAEAKAAQAQQSVMEQSRASVRSQIEEAISNQPKIVHLRETDPDRYNALVEVDQWFVKSPAAQGLSIPQRIAKSLAMYEAQTKPIELAGTPTPATTTAAPAPAPAAPAPAVPNTLSDISGGGLPVTSELDNVDGLTQKQLTDKLSRMSQEEIFAYVGKIPL